MPRRPGQIRKASEKSGHGNCSGDLYTLLVRNGGMVRLENHLFQENTSSNGPFSSQPCLCIKTSLVPVCSENDHAGCVSTSLASGANHLLDGPNLERFHAITITITKPPSLCNSCKGKVFHNLCSPARRPSRMEH